MILENLRNCRIFENFWGIGRMESHSSRAWFGHLFCQTNTHPYFFSLSFLYIFLYICCCVRCVRECSRLCVRKWGAQRPRAGNPYFYSVSWVAGPQQLPQEAPEIRGVVLERHAANCQGVLYVTP